MKIVINKIRLFFSPQRRIARKLRQCENIAGKHYFCIAHGEFGDMARKFEDFE